MNASQWRLSNEKDTVQPIKLLFKAAGATAGDAFTAAERGSLGGGVAPVVDSADRRAKAGALSKRSKMRENPSSSLFSRTPLRTSKVSNRCSRLETRSTREAGTEAAAADEEDVVRGAAFAPAGLLGARDLATGFEESAG